MAQKFAERAWEGGLPLDAVSASKDARRSLGGLKAGRAQILQRVSCGTVGPRCRKKLLGAQGLGSDFPIDEVEDPITPATL